MFTKRTKAALIRGIITKRTPIYVQYAVTKNCNLRCRMCASSISRSQERELSLPEIIKLADVLDRLHAGVILLTGGEPFLRADIAEIIGIFSGKNFTVRLQTNGVLATEEKIRAAYSAGMEEVTVSLDSLIPETSDAITGQQGSWHKIIDSLARFSQILPTRNSVIGINTVVCRQNIREVTSIIKFATEIGFYSSLIPVHTASSDSDDFIIRKHAPGFSFQKEDFEMIDEVYREIINMKRQGYNIYNSYKFLRNSPVFLKTGRVAWHCDSPSLYFAISPSGKFLPCVDIKTSVSMIDGDFCNLYNSKSFQSSIQEKVKKCSGCFYACWPEMTFLCRDPLVLAERIFLGMKAKFKKRDPVSYEQCLRIIDKLRKGPG